MLAGALRITPPDTEEPNTKRGTMTAAPTDAPAPQGFWKIAEAKPDHLALVDPEERLVSAGELLASCNQVVHGLRALGLQPGDAIAMLLPNGVEVFELYLAISQAGFYLIPINWHLVGPEIAYIVSDCEAKVFVAHARFEEHATAAADGIDFPADGRFAVGGDIPGFRSYDELKTGQPSGTPAERATGIVMNYTSGTTGRPKGVRRSLPGTEPEAGGRGFGGMLTMFGLQPFDGNVHIVGSPLYHTAVLVFAGSAIHTGHTVVVMDKWTPEQMLHLIDRYKVTNTHMVPTQFVRLLGLPEDVRAKYDVSSLRHMVHAAAPCPPDVKRQMIEWWGPKIYEYYGATEGGIVMVGPPPNAPVDFGPVTKRTPDEQVKARYAPPDPNAPPPAGRGGRGGGAAGGGRGGAPAPATPDGRLSAAQVNARITALLRDRHHRARSGCVADSS
jgi:long-chain acyl-CoA synthetase